MEYTTYCSIPESQVCEWVANKDDYL